MRNFLVIMAIWIMLCFFFISGIMLATKTTVSQSQKMKECIKAGGQFDVYDYSWKKDGSEYRATCSVPKKELWQLEIK